MLSRRRGVSLPELLVALVVASVLASMLVGIAVSGTRYSRQRAERAFMAANLETSALVLDAELSLLSAGDSTHSDVYALTDTAITYRGLRALTFVCRRPPPRSAVVVVEAEWHGLRELDVLRDSVLIYSGGEWMGLDVVSRDVGTCVDGVPGVSLRLAVSPNQLVSLSLGTPVRVFEVMTLRLYRDRRRVWWLGMRQWNKQSGWSVTQPVAGPLASDGFRLESLDASGQKVPSGGSLVRATLVARSTAPLSRRRPGTHVLDSITVLVALRNSRR